MKTAALLLCALLAGAAASDAKPDDHPGKGRGRDVAMKLGADAELNVAEGLRVVAVGKSPQFKIFPSPNSNSFIQLRRVARGADPAACC